MAKEHDEMPGFYYVPTLTDILINREGKVVDLQKRFCPFPTLGSAGYPIVTANRKSVLLHRMLALTFIPCNTENDVKLEVNHIDGNKRNFSLDNLEWVTRTENIFHAYRTGLKKDNRPVLIKDLLTNEVTRFYGVVECGRQLGKDAATIVLHLSDRNRGKISWGHYVLIYEGQEWPEVKFSMIGKHRNGDKRKVIVTDLDTKKHFIFESIGSAARNFGLKSPTLRARLSKLNKTVIENKEIVYYDEFNQRNWTKVI